MFLSRDPRRGARRSASGPAIRSRPHIVRAFDDDLAAVAADTARLGGAAEDLVSEALRALAPGAPDLAAEAAARRDRLAADARRLTERAAVVLARRQPLAADLRQVLGALRLAGALGRMGISPRTSRPAPPRPRARTPGRWAAG